MKIVVLKFGGTSVGSTDRIKKVAKIITSYLRKRYKVIVVTSAMSGVTNDLVRKSKEISNNFIAEEYDVLVSAGEQMSCSLISGRLNHLGYKSRSWLGWQVPIFTSGNHASARIKNIYKKNIIKYLKSGGIPIIAGFQGINSNSRITTIGRGGTDASAEAVMVGGTISAIRISNAGSGYVTAPTITIGAATTIGNGDYKHKTFHFSSTEYFKLSDSIANQLSDLTSK